MARMYPASPVPNPTTGEVQEGERYVFDVLRRRLPDDWIVMHSVRENVGKINYEADFVVLIPHMGVLVLEVKSHGELRVRDGIWKEFHRDEGWVDMEKNSPLEQAFLASKSFMHKRRMDNTLDEWNAAVWTPAVWRERIRYTSAAILTYIVALPAGGEALLNEEARDTLLNPQERYICGQENLENLDLEALFRSYFGERRNAAGYYVPWYSEWFDEHVMRAIRMKVKPSCDLRLDPAIYNRCLERAAERASLLLEATAESTADVTVKGCAGSGKTVMLRREVRRLYQKAVDEAAPLNILVLCFNKPLAEDLKGHFRACEREGAQAVQVHTFHAFARRELDHYTPGGYQLDKRLEKALKKAKSKEEREEAAKKVWDEVAIHFRDALLADAEPPHYDHIFIDEAQDFEANWFSCLVPCIRPDARRGLKRGRIYYFCDSNQNIRAGSGMSRTPMQMRLMHNLRNARQIACFNARSLTHLPEEQLPIPMEAAYGKEVEIFAEADRQGRTEQLARLVSRLLDEEHVNAADIAVLSPYKAGNPDNSFGSIGSRVRMVSTIRQFKGLEAEHVILTDVVPVAVAAEDDVQSYQDFYVAATRAKYALYILPGIGGKAQLDAWLRESQQQEGARGSGGV